VVSVCPRWLLLIVPVACAWPVWSQTPDTKPADADQKPEQRVVISVGDAKITAAELNRILEGLSPQSRRYYSGPGKHLLPEYLVQMKVLSAEAAKKKLEEQPEVKHELEVARESILADAERKQLQQAIPVSDEELQALYQKRQPEFEDVHIRHILVRTDGSIPNGDSGPIRTPLPEAEARKKLEGIRAKILAGADFAQMAKENSDDTATAASGGDQGYVNRKQIVPPVADVAYALAPGQVSEIINTPFGLDLIKLEDKRTKTLSEVKPLLEQQIRVAKFGDVMQGLENDYKVFVDQQFFGPPPQPKKDGAPAAAH